MRAMVVSHHLHKSPLQSLPSSFRIILCYNTSLKTSDHHISTRIRSSVCQMGHQEKTISSFRLCNVSGRKTELVEIHASNPRFHLLFIPGNPGVVTFYTDFLESLFEQIGETASITGIGHISHSEQDWEHGQLFSLKEQIEHKISFIQQELQALEVPLILLGHSVGSYMSLEIFKQIPEKVAYFIALYPFLAVNTQSQQQTVLKKISRSRLASGMISATVALIGLLPISASKFLAKNLVGKSWSSTALDALCSSVLKDLNPQPFGWGATQALWFFLGKLIIQYHTMNNVLYLVMTEFEELVNEPDWEFIRKKRDRIAFLYGDDDHWGPLHMHDKIVKEVPDAIVEIEREGHTHAFSCTITGSVWVARHVATLINKTIF